MTYKTILDQAKLEKNHVFDFDLMLHIQYRNMARMVANNNRVINEIKHNRER